VRTQLTVKRQRDALRALILTDALTGAANRRAFDERLDAEWRRCGRAGLPVALILVDIDHFKLYNDHYGHQAGDATLVQFATAMRRAAARTQDLVARYGGEEFAILLPQAREVDALNVAERLRAHVAALSVPVEDNDESGPVIKLTISVGVAALTSESQELTDMLAAADAALYHAKETGRNKTHMVSAGPQAP